MSRLIPRVLGVLVLAGALVAVACDANEDVTRDSARDTGQSVQEEARQTWAGLRTDGERLIDQIQTRNDPEVKQQLLDRCRDVEERLRRENAPNVDRVNDLCDSIRDADPNDSAAWTEIKARIDDLDGRFRS
jgi:hypothetical protein